jgi:acetyl-CoA acetyltransferase family protein
MSAIIHASRAIKSGDAEIVLAGGVENMTRGPWVISKTSKPFGNDAQMFDSSFGWRFVNPMMQKMYGIDSMGVTAENLVEKYKISREDQDTFAYQSQMKATNARDSGRLAKEIIPIEIQLKKNQVTKFEVDEFIKSTTTLDVLSQLKPAFKKEGGSVTAGNASGLNDGSAAVFIASENAIKKYGLKPKARIVSSAGVGVEPRIMGIGPVGATRKALGKAGLRLEQIEVIELNEAFAAQSLACTRELGLSDDDPRINPLRARRPHRCADDGHRHARFRSVRGLCQRRRTGSAGCQRQPGARQTLPVAGARSRFIGCAHAPRGGKRRNTLRA